MSSNDAPVLLITFNRPDTTEKVLERILEAKPSQLFIFSDGPRENKPGEEALVRSCRSLFEKMNITWECQVEKWFLEKNMGCGRGVSYAITKTFEKVDHMIILEDDCLPHLSFFTYCQYMLDKYKDVEEVMHIAGTRWNEEFDTGKTDHFFSNIGHIWGWATWKRAWQKYDYEMKDWATYNKKATIKRFEDKLCGAFWNKKFDYAFNNRESLNTWDYQWQFALILNEGVSINPNVNLVSNIGTSGAHGSGSSTNLFKPTRSWMNRFQSPPCLTPLLSFDKYHIRRHFMEKDALTRRIGKKIHKILNWS